MDILKLTTVSEDDGIVVHLKDVGGQLLFDGETPVTIRVAGTYSDRYRRAQRSLRDANVRAMRRGGAPSSDELEVAQYGLEAACIVEWTFTAGDKPFPISPDNWRAIAEKQPQWREQVQQAMTDHERFFATGS